MTASTRSAADSATAEEPVEFQVIVSLEETKCDRCSKQLKRGSLVFLNLDRQTLCLDCAGLGHLVMLPAGDAALSRRAKRHSQLSAVVFKFSRTRKQNERQGLLVEKEALERAEADCQADEDRRTHLRERNAERRARQERAYMDQFAAKILELFPSCPEGRHLQIAEHACEKHTGRVGRSAPAKELDENSVRIAVIAHIRHAETRYDELLLKGRDRQDARTVVAPAVDRVLTEWSMQPAIDAD
jgi:hypothetical protein